MSDQKDTSNQSITRRELLRTGAFAATSAFATAIGTAAKGGTSAGEKIWEFEPGGVVASSPTVVDGTVYVGSNDENLYALNTADGTEQWSFDAHNGLQSQILGAPSVVGGTVYFGTNQRGFGNVYAVDAADGTKRWQYKTGSRVRGSPTVTNGTVYVGNDGGSQNNPAPNLYAIRTEDGTARWSFSVPGNIRSSPTVVNDTVYFGAADGRVYAIDAGDGTEAWSTRLSRFGNVRSSPTVVDGTVYVGHLERDGNNIYALDASDGSVQWSFDRGGVIDSSPTIADGILYVGNSNQRIYAINAADGSVRWTYETGDTVSSSPTVAGNIVYVGSSDGNLYALDREDGTERWVFDTETSIRSSPVVVNGVVYVGSGQVRCCEAGDGTGTVYAIDTGVSGSSRGSRVLLSTLGHHHSWTGTMPPADFTPTDPGNPTAEFVLSVDSIGTVTQGETTRLTLTVENTGSASGAVTVELQSKANSAATTDVYGSEFRIRDQSPAGGTWSNGRWEAADFQAGTTRQPAVTVEAADWLEPGDYTFSFAASVDGTVVDTDTVTITVEQQAFDAAIHGFGFDNWDSASLPQFDELYAVVTGSLIPELRDRGVSTDLPLFSQALAAFLYTGQEFLANGHCAGMVLAARDYYNTGLPDLPDYDEIVRTAADIQDPPHETAVLAPIEEKINTLQNSQVFDTHWCLRYIAAASPISTEDDPIDYIAVLSAIQHRLSNGQPAPVGLIDTITSGHAVLAYDIRLEQNSDSGYAPAATLEESTRVIVDIYDPNYPANSTRAIRFDRDTTTDAFEMTSYEGEYTRAIFIDDIEPDFQYFSAQGAGDAFAEVFERSFEDYLAIGVQSPVELEVTGPGGTTVERLGVETATLSAATDYEALYFGTGLSTGEYSIEVTGTGSGDYTITVGGATPEGQRVSDEYSGRITEGENQQLSLVIPDSDESESRLVRQTSGTEGGTETHFGFTVTEIAAGGAVTVGLAYLSARMLKNQDTD